MDWHKLYFGHVSMQEVQEAVKDPEWQECRKAMKGQRLLMKYCILVDYLVGATEDAQDDHEKRMIQVRVTNYVTALSRGGLIKREDYR